MLCASLAGAWLPAAGASTACTRALQPKMARAQQVSVMVSVGEAMIMLGTDARADTICSLNKAVTTCVAHLGCSASLARAQTTAVRTLQ